MSGPQRIQLHRTKGWRKPENTVVVARPSKWGNPFLVVRAPGWPRWAGPGPWQVVTPDGVVWRSPVPQSPTLGRRAADRESKRMALDLAVELFSLHIGPLGNYEPDNLDEWIQPLRGKNLACWCPLDQPCHADVLLELANEARP